MAGKMITTILKKFTDERSMQKRGFFSTFFKTTEEDYTDTDTVEIDIERNGMKVAPTMKNRNTGAIVMSAEDFTTKEFTPPSINLAMPVDLYGLMERQPGEKDNAEVVGAWKARLFGKLFKNFVKLHKMIKETVELQAAQILQTGTVTLQDENGNDAYVLAYPVKASHFPTVTNKWDAAGANPLADIQAVCEAIQDDGKVDAQIAIFGRDAWNAAIKNADFQNAVKVDGLNLGALNPGLKNKGGRYMGYINIGTDRLDMYVYNDSYEKVNGTTKYRYMDSKKVVITAAIEDLDFRTVYGGVPSLGMKEPFTSVMPAEVFYDGSIRVNNRVYEDEKADTFMAEAKSRPLSIPVSIDAFGCLTVLA